MVKQIKVHNQELKMYSWDGGRSWCSSQKAMLPFHQRRKRALETKLTPKELAWIDMVDRGLDPRKAKTKISPFA